MDESTNTKGPLQSHREEVASELPPVAVEDSGATQQHADPVALEQQRQQLQLIQLCFYEHEFGVDIDDVDDDTAASSPDKDGLNGSLLDFDPLAFIDGKVSHGVALDDLCKDLSFYIDYIKGKINYHVNNDMHTAFVDVSGRLGGMESELQYVERPLGASIKKVAAACDELASAASAVDVKVQHASDVEEERVFDVNLLKGLLLYERIATTIEEEIEPLVDASLAAAAAPVHSQAALPWKARNSESIGRDASLTPFRGSVSNSGGGFSSSPTAPSSGERSTMGAAVIVKGHLLEKLKTVAMSTKQLSALASMLPSLSQREKEKAELISYVRESNTAVLRLLRRIFEHLCSTFFDHPEEAGIAQALREVTLIYTHSRARDAFCSMFRESVLAPFLEKIFPWKAATQARQSAEETVRLLGRLETELRSNVTPLFPLFRRCFADEPLNPSTTILWPVLCEVLVKKLVTLYEVGIPDAFHRKYKAAYKLLALAESCCATPEELLSLRQSPDVAMWNHKWNTDVYTAMRLTEATKAVDSALTPYRNGKPMTELTAGSGEGPEAGKTTDAVAVGVELSVMNLEVFRVLQEQLFRLFSKDVFLLVCLQKFLRESATTTQKVCKTVLQYTAQALKTAGSSNADENVTRFLSLLMTDVGRLAELCSIGGALYTHISKTLADCGVSGGTQVAGGTPVSQAVDGVLALIREFVCRRCVGEAQHLLTSSVETECLAALQNLKSVRSAYSHTKKPFPAVPSWYVPSVTDPIARFAKVCSENGVDAAGVRSMVGSITDSVATQFTALARETLITAKKTEESWEKLRKRKDQTTAGGSGVNGESTGAFDSTQGDGRPPTADTATDRDKMTIQLYLDARAFEDATQPLLADGPAKLPRTGPMEALFSLLRRAEWITGANIAEPPEIEES